MKHEYEPDDVQGIDFPYVTSRDCAVRQAEVDLAPATIEQLRKINERVRLIALKIQEGRREDR